MSIVIDIDPPPVDRSKARRPSATIRKKLLALDALLEGDAKEHRATFEALKSALNADRKSSRKVFS